MSDRGCPQQTSAAFLFRRTATAGAEAAGLADEVHRTVGLSGWQNGEGGAEG